MKKYIWIFFGVALISVILAVVFVREEGELKSPQENVTFNDGDLKIDVIYGRPSKRGREIFGGLVPYDKTWRTGANEATEFHTSVNLNFKGQSLNAGNYSVWTQPGTSSWKVFFNSNIPEWGVDENGNVAKDSNSDVITVDVTPESVADATEMFTMKIEKSDSAYNLIFNWDKTRVSVPFTRQ